MNNERAPFALRRTGFADEAEPTPTSVEGVVARQAARAAIAITVPAAAALAARALRQRETPLPSAQAALPAAQVVVNITVVGTPGATPQPATQRSRPPALVIPWRPAPPPLVIPWSR